ncbi:MAG: hypothetical protein WCD37_15165, partial [Chloroflexia bacterium]
IDRGRIQSSGEDSGNLTGAGSMDLSGRGGTQLVEEDGSHLPRTIKRKHAGGTSARYQGGIARALHKIESEQEESEKKIDDSNQPPRNRTFAGSETGITPPPYSPYIASVISDFSHELNDPSHIISNVTQALRLWSTSDLNEQQFTDLLYEAKRLTRTYQGKNGLHGIDNKMAYFFRVARDLCTNLGQG